MQTITGFADASKWIVKNGVVVYAPQNHSYKEVLLGGTPIEYFLEGEVPEAVLGKMEIQVRLPKIRDDREEEKMPTLDFVEDDEQVIGSGGWVDLSKKELLEFPWIKEPYNNKNCLMDINDCHGFDILGITDAGAILTSTRRIYIRRNMRKPSRLVLVSLSFYDGKWQEIEKNTIYTAYTHLMNPEGYWIGGRVKYFFDDAGKSWALPEGAWSY